MNEEVRVFSVSAMDMLSLSVLVLFLGNYLNRKFRFLSDNYIPPAVTGGLLFSLFTWFVYEQLGVKLEFDMRIRDLLLLVFFTTVGLSARLSTLASGGPALVRLVFAAFVLLSLENVVGITVALLSGAHPAYGLFAGSISFAGGHGTAIAWGAVAEDAGLEGAATIGLAFATFGLVAGGLVGGPIARILMQHTPPPEADDEAGASATGEAAADAETEDSDWLFQVLGTLLILALCVSLGDLANRYLFSVDVKLPGFLTAMFVGIVITNVADTVRQPVAKATIDKFGEVSLHIFLAMSMMAIQLWSLGDAASVILLVLVAQVLVMTVFAVFVVYRLMGRDYDAVVIASGFAGMGLGATPVAIANMNALTQRYGPSTKAFLVVPLVGAFFIDLLNAGSINFFIGLIKNYLI